MHTFIIDNGSKYVENLSSFFTKQNTTIINYNEINNYKIGNNDLVVLSGGHHNPVLWHPKEYEQETSLVKAHGGPIIGVCLGFQLIAHVFGAHFHLLDDRRKGLFAIEATANGLADLPNKKYTVYENHRWSTSTVAHPLIALAVSSDGIELIKHESRQIYAMQFHPEGEGTNDGKEILEIILGELNYR